MHQRLYRSNNERMFLGVCGGIAERFDIDPTLVRLAFALLFFTGPGLIVYLICALVIPRAPELGAGAHMRAMRSSSSSHSSHSSRYAPSAQHATSRR